MPPSSSPAAAADPHRRTAPRRLRPVAAGYDITAWPLRVDRAAEETLEGWLLRLSQRYGLHPPCFWPPPVCPFRRNATPGWPSSLPAHRDVLAATLGVPPGDLAEHRSDLAAVLVDLRRWHRAQISGAGRARRPRGSSWCPRCLAGDGRWRESWTDPLHLSCAHHQVRLEYLCPRCFIWPFSQPTWLTSTAGPLACAAFVEEPSGRYRSRCRTRLDRVPAVPAEPELLAAQAFVFDLAHRGARAGRHRRGHRRRQPGRGRLLRRPRPPRLRRGFARSGRTSSTCRSAPAPLSADAPATRCSQPSAFTACTGGSPSAGSRSSGSAAASPATRPSGCGRRSPTLPSGRPTAPLPMAHIPQLLWPGRLRLDDHAGLALDSPIGRAFAAVALARYGSARPWQVIATNLGLPGHAAATCHRHWTKIHRTGRWRGYLTALDDLFQRLHDQPPPIDYEQRRLSAGDVPLLRRLARAACRTAGQTRRRDDAHALAARFWQTYTAGHLIYAPHRWRLKLRSSPARPLDDCLPTMHQALHRADPDADDGPLTWLPP